MQLVKEALVSCRSPLKADLAKERTSAAQNMECSDEISVHVRGVKVPVRQKMIRTDDNDMEQERQPISLDFNMEPLQDEDINYLEDVPVSSEELANEIQHLGDDMPPPWEPNEPERESYGERAYSFDIVMLIGFSRTQILTHKNFYRLEMKTMISSKVKILIIQTIPMTQVGTTATEATVQTAKVPFTMAGIHNCQTTNILV